VIVPRLYRRLLDDPTRLPLGEAVWQDTLIELPREERSQNRFHGVLDAASLTPARHGEVTGIPVARALGEFPVALLYSEATATVSGVNVASAETLGSEW